jgi:hypothetical protein
LSVEYRCYPEQTQLWSVSRLLEFFFENFRFLARLLKSGFEPRDLYGDTRQERLFAPMRLQPVFNLAEEETETSEERRYRQIADPP